MPRTNTATAYAHTNIALIKYWGKRQTELNLPATGSLSLTLQDFGTRTRVSPIDGPDSLVLDGETITGAQLKRVSLFLDLLRKKAGSQQSFAVESKNDVPTAAGLASSASAFAALTLAGTRALGLDLSPRDLSVLARQGSGSACRSIFGGFVLWHMGKEENGEDSHAEALSAAPNLDVRLLVVRCATGKKKVGSTQGMNHTAQTSAYYPLWVDSHAADLNRAIKAVGDGDFSELGSVMELSTLKMHASALAADPGLWYFNPTTVAVMNAVRAARDDGLEAYFTMDAGPHVKVLCPTAKADAAAALLKEIDGVFGVDITGPGPGAFLVTEGDAP
jgi:diphosphomevalonate decarboxylase